MPESTSIFVDEDTEQIAVYVTAETESVVVFLQEARNGIDSDMLKATYDPRNKAADAFNLSNHTGNITSASVLIDGGLL